MPLSVKSLSIIGQFWLIILYCLYESCFLLFLCIFGIFITVVMTHIKVECVNFCCMELIQSCIYIFFISFLSQLITGYWIQSPVLYSSTLLFSHAVYTSLHLLIPNSWSTPPLPSVPLVTPRLFSTSVILISYNICLSLSDLVWSSLGPSILTGFFALVIVHIPWNPCFYSIQFNDF